MRSICGARLRRVSPAGAGWSLGFSAEKLAVQSGLLAHFLPKVRGTFWAVFGGLTFCQKVRPKTAKFRFLLYLI